MILFIAAVLQSLQYYSRLMWHGIHHGTVLLVVHHDTVLLEIYHDTVLHGVHHDTVLAAWNV